MTYENDIPDYALVPAKELEEQIVVPITKGAIYTPVQVTDIREKNKTTITIEEDILVPDIKPDLKEILLIDGKCHLSNREVDQITKDDDYINLSGEIDLQTLYLPEKEDGNNPIISVQTRVPFKDQWHTSLSEGATLVLNCKVEKIDYMVINERKYRVKILLSVTAREYMDTKVNLFEGLIDEEIQVLKETIETSNIALRKKDSISVKEDFAPKDGCSPQSILKQDINVVENYKQTTGDKVVINGFIYVSLLYTSCQCQDELPPSNNIYQLQERVEFTQFIPIQQSGQWSGCSVSFDDNNLKVKLTQDETENDIFRLEGELITFVDLYKNMEREVIVDGYHRQKDFICDFVTENSKTLVGITASETSLREILSLENMGLDIDCVLYCAGDLLSAESRVEQSKIITEGKILAKMICKDSSDDSNIFAVKEEIPFRVITNVPQLEGNEVISHKIYIKDIWSEKINGKQLEFNSTVLVCCEILRPTPFIVLTNPAFIETSSCCQAPPMVIYICNQGDTLWQIAKKFKTTMGTIRQVNNLDTDSLSPRQKLLIVK